MGSINMMVDGYSVLDSMFFLLLDSIIYYLLGRYNTLASTLLIRYFDNVIPKEYGLSLPWNYLFTKSYWTGQIANKKKVYSIRWLSLTRRQRRLVVLRLKCTPCLMVKQTLMMMSTAD